MMTFVKADGVGKVYAHLGRQTMALKEVRFSAEVGEFIVITGESGAGKSTLLSLIGGLDVPTEGRIRVASTDLTAMDAAALAGFRLENIGFVFQDFCLVRHLNALGNVRLPILFSKGEHKHRRAENAEALLRRFNMLDNARRRPAFLSRGELQRVALARALVNEPRLLLADEPTANLDGRNAKIIWDHFAELNQNERLTIIAVTHSHDFAPGVTRVLTLDRGLLVEDRRI